MLFWVGEMLRCIARCIRTLPRAHMLTNQEIKGRYRYQSLLSQKKYMLNEATYLTLVHETVANLVSLAIPSPKKSSERHRTSKESTDKDNKERQ